MTATATPDILALLDQTAVWVTKDGRTIQLPDLEDGHRRNLVAWLERSAGRLSRIAEARAWRASMSVEIQHGHDVPDGVFSAMSQWESDARHAVTDPLGWLRGKPLYAALTDPFYHCPKGSVWRSRRADSRRNGYRPPQDATVVRTQTDSTSTYDGLLVVLLRESGSRWTAHPGWLIEHWERVR